MTKFLTRGNIKDNKIVLCCNKIEKEERYTILDGKYTIIVFNIPSVI